MPMFSPTLVIYKTKKPWGTYEWTRCPVASCKARYKYNSGSNSLRTIAKHNKKVLSNLKVVLMGRFWNPKEGFCVL